MKILKIIFSICLLITNVINGQSKSVKTKTTAIFDLSKRLNSHPFNKASKIGSID